MPDIQEYREKQYLSVCYKKDNCIDAKKGQLKCINIFAVYDLHKYNFETKISAVFLPRLPPGLAHDLKGSGQARDFPVFPLRPMSCLPDDIHRCLGCPGDMPARVTLRPGTVSRKRFSENLLIHLCPAPERICKTANNSLPNNE
ncbi:MAG: hypothetical protein R2941_17180 [Desulfobacterales bacterium]